MTSKMPRLKHSLNRDLFPVQSEINDQPSMTIPDDSLTVEEIMRRFALGQSMPGNNPVYDEDENGEPMDLPDLRKLDISEIHDLIEQNNEKIDALQKEARERVEEDRRKKTEAEIEKKFLARQVKKDILKKPSPPGNEGTDKKNYTGDDQE